MAHKLGLLSILDLFFVISYRLHHGKSPFLLPPFGRLCLELFSGIQQANSRCIIYPTTDVCNLTHFFPNFCVANLQEEMQKVAQVLAQESKTNEGVLHCDKSMAWDRLVTEPYHANRPLRKGRLGYRVGPYQLKWAYYDPYRWCYK